MNNKGEIKYILIKNLELIAITFQASMLFVYMTLFCSFLSSTWGFCLVLWWLKEQLEIIEITKYRRLYE